MPLTAYIAVQRPCLHVQQSEGDASRSGGVAVEKTNTVLSWIELPGIINDGCVHGWCRALFRVLNCPASLWCVQYVYFLKGFFLLFQTERYNNEHKFGPSMIWSHYHAFYFSYQMDNPSDLSDNFLMDFSDYIWLYK